MKIATWNLNWPRTASKIVAIIDELKRVDADVLVLTETSDVINPGAEYRPLLSDFLPAPRPYAYEPGDHETIIWSKYPLSRVKTRHPSITVCAKVQTPNGDLNVYGTVIGILGPIGPNKEDFMQNLREQIEDWNKICNEEGKVCIVGDFNVCWSKGFSKAGRDQIDSCFDKLGILNLTRNIERGIDHIAISNHFLDGAEVKILPPWNDPPDKKISDHKGICIHLEFPMANTAALEQIGKD